MSDGLGDMVERKKILGTWRIASDESQGVELAPTDPRAGGAYWLFAEMEAATWIPSDSMAIRYPGFHIDPSATPKRLDILNSDGKNTIYQTGIYKFEGDKLIWVRDTTARKGENEPRKRILWTFRPTGYRTRPGDGRERMVLERVPDDNKEAVPPDGSK